MVKSKHKVISIDGGGIKGIVAIKVLMAIEEEMQELLTNNVSLVAGTSTGAIIAASVAKGIPMGVLLDKYIAFGEDVFKNSFSRKVSNLFGLRGSKYKKEDLSGLIYKELGTDSIGSVYNDLLIPSYNMTKARPEIFTSKSNIDLGSAVIASASAPTYFKPMIINGSEYIDGGIIANNPSMLAYTEIKSKYNSIASDISILSIGCGSSPKNYNNASKWPTYKWIKPLLDIAVNSDMSIVHNQLVKVYNSIKTPENSIRINENITKSMNSNMDDASRCNINTLIEFGDYVVAKNSKRIKESAAMMSKR